MDKTNTKSVDKRDIINYFNLIPLKHVDFRVMGLNRLWFKRICLYIRVLEKILLPGTGVSNRILHSIALTLDLF
jgi:hypothetical protein